MKQIKHISEKRKSARFGWLSLARKDHENLNLVRFCYEGKANHQEEIGFV